MRGIKVQGQANLVRSAAIPGLILNNNSTAAAAALKARQRQETQDETIQAQAIQITQLQDTLKAVLQHVGLSEGTNTEEDQNGV